MTERLSDNKRIAKNTLLLYFRMLLLMGVSFFTVRVVLSHLGVIDYGLYNVVGGIVIMFSFLSGTMATASQRFFAYELGRNNLIQLKRIFSITMTIYLIIGIIILVLAETIGIWFLNHKMSIPQGRAGAAQWVYQFSILSFMMTMFTIPYNAAIIAHENMKVYAYVSIVEIVLKLLIVYLLTFFSFDKLKLYAVLLFAVTFVVTLLYRIYCKRNYAECRFKPYWNKELFNEMAAYSGWNLFGAMAGVFNNQGVNIILNLFFGPVVNAARGIAYQVNTAINQFVLNFMTASRPQITKYHAQGDDDQMMQLVFRSAKFSFFLLSFISMPVLLDTRFVLSIWLTAVPSHAVLFTKLIIINALIDCLSYPLMAAVQATGKIRKYQAIVGSVMLLNVPVAYVLLKLGLPAESVFYASICNSACCLFIRLFLLTKLVHFSVGEFVRKVVLISVVCFFVSYYAPLGITASFDPGVKKFLIVGLSSTIITSVAIFSVGLSKIEKKFITNNLKVKLSRI